MNYHLAFKLLKTHFPTGFGGSGAPKTFMTDDSCAERNALKSVFPQTSLILCTFHVCQAVWRWLWDGKNKVDIKDRKKLMLEFRSILYAQTEEESKEFFGTLCVGCKYSNFVNYLKNLWERKNEWCHFYRQSLCTRGHNTNNFVEASIRVLKDIILERCKSFNVVALLGFITEILETYHKRRLISFASNRHSKNNLSYLKFKNKTNNLRVQKIDEETFLVSSDKDKNMEYTILTNCGLCNCPSGTGGAFCKHLYAVECSFGVNIATSPQLLEKDIQLLNYLATGVKSNSFFKAMIEKNETITSEQSTCLENPTQCDPINIDHITTCSTEKNKKTGEIIEKL